VAFYFSGKEVIAMIAHGLTTAKDWGTCSWCGDEIAPGEKAYLNWCSGDIYHPHCYEAAVRYAEEEGKIESATI